MDVISAFAPDRPGKNSVWTALPPRRRPTEATRSAPASTLPGGAHGMGSLDGVRAIFWQTYKHLFPPHSLAAQTANGGIVISWSIMDDPNASYPYAAPVMLRFDDALVELMWNSDARQRRKIAETHEPTLREGLRGYDPFAKVPKARVISIG
jgi:hypothetical protein